MSKQRKERRCAVMYANLDRPDSKWISLGQMDLPSAKGQVTRMINRGGGGMYPKVGYRKKSCEGITHLAFKNGGEWVQGGNALAFEAAE